MAINVALQRAIAHLKHLLHILTKKSIATCFSSSYLCLRQNDTTDVNFQIAMLEEQKNIFTKYSEFLNYFDPSLHLEMNTSDEKSNL